METAVASETQVTEPQTTEATGLSDAITESKTAISEAAAPKSKGGRPKGYKMPRDENGNVIKANASPEKKAAAKAAIVAPAIPPEYLKPVINFPFMLAAKRTGFDGFNLSDQEQLQNAELLEKCMARYFPQLQTDHAELVGLALGVGIAFYGRFLSYQEYRQSKLNSGGNTPGKENPDSDATGRNENSKVEKITRNRNDSGIKPSLALSSLLDGNQTSPL